MGICSGVLLFVWAVELEVANALVFVARKRWERVLGPELLGVENGRNVGSTL